jgi:hypothetical protein
LLAVELHCPVCGNRLEEKANFLGDFACDYCGKVSTRRSCLAALSRAEKEALPLGTPPEGVEFTEGDDFFRCAITKSDGVGPAFLWLTTAAIVVASLIFFHERHLASADFWICFGIFAVLVVVMGCASAYFTFGADTVLGTVDTLEFRTGYRRWSLRRIIRRADIRRVVLVRQSYSDSEGSNRLEFALSCELVDGQPEFRFAAGQSYPRLAWLARYLAGAP